MGLSEAPQLHCGIGLEYRRGEGWQSRSIGFCGGVVEGARGCVSAGGRRVRALAWMRGASALALLAAPYPEPGLEDGAGDVLVQVGRG
jgi:hypothetical protein